jgi:hypothetical protein
MFENIPEELQHIGQWINWRYGTTDTGKQTKHPVTPGFGYLASVTDPSTWRTFAEAVSYARNNPSFIAGIGFVFTKETLYSGIDLDHLDNPDDHKRAVAIVEHFDTYTETSPSGRGLHLIVKGKVASGRRKAGVELYPHGRYFTFTGNVVRNRPIASRHFELEELWKELGGAQLDETGFDGDPTQTNSDLEVYNMAVAARNGQLFLDLWQGRWDEQRREDNSKRYTSQSEADFALIDIIAFYTQNREQITRLFFTSALGQREKAQARKDYVPKMIKRSFDRMLPKVNFDAIANQANDARERIEAAARSAPAYTPPAPAPAVWDAPGGSLGGCRDALGNPASPRRCGLCGARARRRLSARRGTLPAPLRTRDARQCDRPVHMAPRAYGRDCSAYFQFGLFARTRVRDCRRVGIHGRLCGASVQRVRRHGLEPLHNRQRRNRDG